MPFSLEGVAVLELPSSQPLGDELDGGADVGEAVNRDDAGHNHGGLGLGKDREHQTWEREGGRKAGEEIWVEKGGWGVRPWAGDGRGSAAAGA